MVEFNSSCFLNQAEKHEMFFIVMILVLDSFHKQGIVFWFFALEYVAGEIK